MTVSLDIKVNDVVIKSGELYRYALALPQQRMLFLPVDPDRGTEFTCDETGFEKLLQNREIRSYDVVRDANGDIIAESDRIDLDPSTEDSKKLRDARALFYFLQKWHKTPSSKYERALTAFVRKHSADARRHGHDWMPSRGALHRAINKYPDIEQLTARFLISKSGETARQRWHPGVSRILEEIIDWYWEENTPGRNKIDAEAHFDSLFDEAAKIIARDTAFDRPLEKPSSATIRAYINSAECYETVARKFTKQRADAQFAGNVNPIPAKKLLEVVLIDSTIMDSWCVLDDETMLPLGRPTLTIAIDLFTRMILAAIVTFEPPSLFTAMACLKRVNTPKDDIHERWPTVLRKSDGWGKPQMVVVDNELAQVGKSYQSACEDAKISVRWAPVARPQYKAVVERFFLTLKKILLDKLPGGMPYKPEIMRQLGIDPKEVATITLDKLNELVNMAINDIYHYHPHSTIGTPPALAWEKSKQRHKRPFIGDVDFLEKAFGALRTGTLTTSGIKFEHMIFHDPDVTSGLLDDLRKPLAWKRAVGISFCESCLDDDSNPTTDLRDFHPQTIPTGDMELYRAVVRLIADPNTRGAAIPPYFDSWQGWEIFDMINMLAIFLSKRFGERTLLAAPKIFALEDWHDNFMRAARAVWDWPEGLSTILALMRATASSRPGRYSRAKELGPLASFGRHYGAIPKASQALAAAVTKLNMTGGRTKLERVYQALDDRTQTMISYREAIQKHNIAPRFLTSIAVHGDVEVIRHAGADVAPTFFNEAQLVELWEARCQLLQVDRLPVMTGFPLFVVLGLVQSRHVRAADGAVARFRELAVSRSEVRRIESLIEANSAGDSSARDIPIMKAAQTAGDTGGRLSLSLIRRCFDGILRYSLAKRGRTLAARIMLPPATATELAHSGHQHEPPAPAPVNMSHLDVELYLDIPAEDIAGLISSGLLRKSNTKKLRTISGESVSEFNARYLTTTSVARNLNRRSRVIRTLMARRGIEPAHTFNVPNRPLGCVWHRHEIQALFEKSA